MPNNIGLSNFLGTFGINSTVFVFAISLNLIVNPDNQTADIRVVEGEGYVNYFPDEVALRLPYWWLCVGTLCVVQAIVCRFLMTDNTNTENKFVEHLASIISSENLSNSSEKQKSES